ncbi:MAG TPA: YeeE/YedE family protein [Vicinamibacterales bacterium]
MSVLANTRPLATPFDRSSVQRTPALSALAVLILGVGYIAATVSAKQAALFLVGTAAGVILYHAAFGFTSSWRHFIVDGRGAGLRAQMLMLAATCLVFFPVLAAGQMFGQPVRGSVSPVSVSVIVGAFLFGVGMQLGGGCASGTLYTVGGGNSRMLATLSAFIAGSVLGATHLSAWEALPSAKPFSLVTRFGATGGLAISLTVMAVIALLTIVVERSRHGQLARENDLGRSGWTRALRGPWPLVAGALGLAAVNIATLAIAGRPWGVTGAFVLWGGKLLNAAGADLTTWRYFAPAARQAELHAPMLKDITSVMDFGIMLGALFAATMAGRFAPGWRTSSRSLAAAVLGGLLLGYGARIAYGCNIGAFFSGVSSGSLHGWIWFPSALLGNVLGVRLRPIFNLSVRS